MPSKLGVCIQCNKPLMVRDTNGRINSIKPDAYDADVVFEAGTRMNISICSACVHAPNLEKILEEAMHPGSRLLSAAQRNYITQKELGALTGITNIRKKRR